MFNKTVDQVLTQFKRTITELKAIETREVKKQDSLDIQIDRLRKHRESSVDEMQRAKRISDKLSKLVE